MKTFFFVSSLLALLLLSINSLAYVNCSFPISEEDKAECVAKKQSDSLDSLNRKLDDIDSKLRSIDSKLDDIESSIKNK